MSASSGLGQRKRNRTVGRTPGSRGLAAKRGTSTALSRGERRRWPSWLQISPSRPRSWMAPKTIPVCSRSRRRAWRQFTAPGAGEDLRARIHPDRELRAGIRRDQDGTAVLRPVSRLGHLGQHAFELSRARVADVRRTALAQPVRARPGPSSLAGRPGSGSMSASSGRAAVEGVRAVGDQRRRAARASAALATCRMSCSIRSIRSRTRSPGPLTSIAQIRWAGREVEPRGHRRDQLGPASRIRAQLGGQATETDQAGTAQLGGQLVAAGREHG